MIVQLDVPAGRSAAWLSLAGDPKRRSELELLLPRRTRVMIEQIGNRNGTPTVEGRLAA